MSIIDRGTLIGPNTVGTHPSVPVFKRDGGRQAAELSADGRGPLSVSLSPPQPNSSHPTPNTAEGPPSPTPIPLRLPQRGGRRSRPQGCGGRGVGGRGPEVQAGGARAASTGAEGSAGGGAVPGAGGIGPMAFCPASCQHYVRSSV